MQPIKGKMKFMKEEITKVLGGNENLGSYQAFDIENESVEHMKLKVSFNENDRLVQYGRLLIKNRINNFSLQISKANMRQ